MNKAAAVFAMLLLVMLQAGHAMAATHQIKVTVDPRMELLSAVMLCADYMLLTREDFPYKQEMAGYFGEYKDHRAVQLFNEMAEDSFNFNAPPELMLCLSGPPELEARDLGECYGPDGAAELVARGGGLDKLTEFVEALQQFAIDTNFQQFYDAHAADYAAMIATVEGNVSDVDLVGSLEEYYGSAKPLAATIMLAPLFHSGGFGPRVERGDGTLEIFNICGPREVVDGLPSWGSPESIIDLTWHELGHSFANPLVDKYAEELARCEVLYKPMEQEMSMQAYPNWQICMYEHMVRVVQARLILAERGAEAAERDMEYERGRGFVYVDALGDCLARYEQQRGEYPTLDSYFPELLAELEQVSTALKAGEIGLEFYGKKAICSPSISPDGSQLAYCTTAFNADGDQCALLWLTDPTGAQKRMLADFAAPEINLSPCIAWLDDSHVCVSAASSVQVVATDGSRRIHEIPKDDYTNPLAAVSPDGKYAAFRAYHGESWGVFLLDIATGAITELNQDTSLACLAWSPDSTKLAYGAGGYNEREKRLKIVDIAGGAEQETGIESGTGPMWSRDGAWLAYTGDWAKGRQYWESIPIDGAIYKLNAATNEVQRLTAPGQYVEDEESGREEISGALMPVWSPDGTRIAYRNAHMIYEGNGTLLNEDELWVMNADGTGQRKLLDKWAMCSWTPDGTALVVSTKDGAEIVEVGEE